MSEMRPRTRPSREVRRRRTILIASIVGAALVIGTVVTILALTPRAEEVAMPTPSVSPSKTPTSTPAPTPTPTPTPTFDKAALSIDDPNSNWVVVNKLRPLNPAQYEPDLVYVDVPYVYEPYMRPEAANALIGMFAAFTAETGLQMQSQSAYRSYWSQESVYAGWVAQLGQEQADLESARPGHSEHQTGLTMDVSAVPNVCALEACFGDTPQGQWLAANSWKHGFIVRYPQGKTEITGYIWEPWHMRYVGVELATEMHETGTATLEEFFGLPAAPTYG